MVVQACASMLPGRSKAVAGVLLLAVVLLASGGQLSRVCRPVTIEHEYHFLKDALPKLPSCAVVFRPFEPDEDLSGGFRDTDLLARGLDNVTWRGWPLAAPPNGCSAYFYRSPLCQVAYVSGTAPPHYPGRATVHERCLEGARRSKDRPLLSAELPALVWGVEQYRDDTVVIGFYELRSASQAHDPP